MASHHLPFAITFSWKELKFLVELFGKPLGDCHYIRVQDSKDDGFLPRGSPDSIHQNNKPQILA